MSRQSAALRSATQCHAMPPEFGRKWETECLNTRFSLITLLWAGYSVKPKKTKNKNNNLLLQNNRHLYMHEVKHKLNCRKNNILITLSKENQKIMIEIIDSNKGFYCLQSII